MRIKREKGFTLIELMIVVAIIGILAAVAIPKFADLIDKAREAKAKASLSSLRSAMTIYYGGTEGTAPGNLFTALVTTYIKELPPIDFKASDKTVIKWSKDLWVTKVVGTNDVDDRWSYSSTAFEVWIGSQKSDLKAQGIHTW